MSRREGIASVLAGAGLLFSLGCIGMIMGALITDEWYITRFGGETIHFSWSGPIIADLDKSLSWTTLENLHKLYRTTLGFGITTIVVSFLASISFAFSSFLRFNYNWQSAPWLSDPTQLGALRCRSVGVVAHFQNRNRHGRALLWTDLTNLVLSCLILALLLTTVTVFSRHPIALSDDLGQDCTLACDSFIGGDGDDFWRPGNGWSMACASICLPLALVFISISAFFIRNNRFTDQDHLVLDAHSAASKRHPGFGVSHAELLLASSVWQAQEKSFLYDEYFTEYVEHPSDRFATDTQTTHIDREEIGV